MITMQDRMNAKGALSTKEIATLAGLKTAAVRARLKAIDAAPMREMRPGRDSWWTFKEWGEAFPELASMVGKVGA